MKKSIRKKPIKKSGKKKLVKKKLVDKKLAGKKLFGEKLFGPKGVLEPIHYAEELEDETQRFKYTFDKKFRRGKYFLEDRYKFRLETGVTAKKNWFTYRDHYTGRFVKKDKVDEAIGGVRMELWRYSKNAEHRFKLLWKDKKYVYLQKPRSLDRERILLRRFYARNKSRFVWDKDLQTWVAFTRSP